VHARWAGGPSDVWKQAVLAVVVRALAVEGRSLSYLETHAGAGLHSVRPYAAWREGVGGLIERGAASELCRAVAQHAAPWLTGRGWQPGSWHFAAALLAARGVDVTMELWERDPLVYEDACRVAASIETPDDGGTGGVRIRVQRGDGFQALGPACVQADLVLLDPPYILDGNGLEGDWELVARAMAALRERDATALAWYPVFGEERAGELVRASRCEGYELILGQAWRGKDEVAQGSGLLATPRAAALLDAAEGAMLEAAAELRGTLRRRR
jgi:23S rRNA (adenine2030-N6)-methyltransferase